MFDCVLPSATYINNVMAGSVYRLNVHRYNVSRPRKRHMRRRKSYADKRKRRGERERWLQPGNRLKLNARKNWSVTQNLTHRPNSPLLVCEVGLRYVHSYTEDI